MQIYLAKYTFLLKICARTCVYEKLFVILHPLLCGCFFITLVDQLTSRPVDQKKQQKQPININIYANNQTETWIGHSV